MLESNKEYEYEYECAIFNRKYQMKMNFHQCSSEEDSKIWQIELRLMLTWSLM